MSLFTEILYVTADSLIFHHQSLQSLIKFHAVDSLSNCEKQIDPSKKASIYPRFPYSLHEDF